MATKRMWKVNAEKGKGLTSKELLDVLELAPPNSEPTVTLRGFSGRIASITIETSQGEK